MRDAFIQYLQDRHPGLKSIPTAQFNDWVSERLLSPFVLDLSPDVLERIQRAVKAINALRGALASSSVAASSWRDPGNASTMMSLDFHVTDAGELKLIEVNTNAAFLIMGTEMYRFRQLKNPAGPFDETAWSQDLHEELRTHADAFGHTVRPKPLAVITDQAPEQQRMYIEFLLAREWLREQGWQAEIRPLEDAVTEPRPDFIYNRWTDFYLERPESAALRAAYADGSVCVSPHPREYGMLADKQNLIEWGRPGFLEKLAVAEADRETLKDILPFCLDLSMATPNELWTRRKELFFKPKREFGSKRAYKGGSISRTHFDQMIEFDPLAQQYIPPGEREFQTPEGPQTFRFDLRCHFYRDRLEGVIARLYRGQVTNLQTPYGGFTPVNFGDKA